MGAELEFSLTPSPSPGERGTSESKGETSERGRETADKKYWKYLKDFSKHNRSNQTREEEILWEELRNNKLGHKIRRQHVIDVFIADFVCLDRRLVIEVDGESHKDNKEYDTERTELLNEHGFNVIRFTNDEVRNNLGKVLSTIKTKLDESPSIKESNSLSSGEGRGEAKIKVFTTRPDTIFGVDFMVLAPEHDLVKQIMTAGQKEEVEKYLK